MYENLYKYYILLIRLVFLSLSFIHLSERTYKENKSSLSKKHIPMYFLVYVFVAMETISLPKKLWSNLKMKTKNCFLGLHNSLYKYSQRDRRQRALLQHQNFDFLFYLGWSGCFTQSKLNIMKVVQS